MGVNCVTNHFVLFFFISFSPLELILRVCALVDVTGKWRTFYRDTRLTGYHSIYTSEHIILYIQVLLSYCCGFRCCCCYLRTTWQEHIGSKHVVFFPPSSAGGRFYRSHSRCSEVYNTPIHGLCTRV